MTGINWRRHRCEPKLCQNHFSFFYCFYFCIYVTDIHTHTTDFHYKFTLRKTKALRDYLVTITRCCVDNILIGFFLGLVFAKGINALWIFSLVYSWILNEIFFSFFANVTISPNLHSNCTRKKNILSNENYFIP